MENDTLNGGHTNDIQIAVMIRPCCWYWGTNRDFLTILLRTFSDNNYLIKEGLVTIPWGAGLVAIPWQGGDGFDLLAHCWYAIDSAWVAPIWDFLAIITLMEATTFPSGGELVAIPWWQWRIRLSCCWVLVYAGGLQGFASFSGNNYLNGGLATLP